MKTYSVKQIADMLETNPETVRRWIREKKLESVQISRKDGNVITENELQRFLKAKPKYAMRIHPGLFTPSPLGISMLIGTLVGNKLMGYYSDKSSDATIVRQQDIIKYLKDNISTLEKRIAHKQATIKQLEKDISEDEEQLNQLKQLLNTESQNERKEEENE